MKNSLRMKSSNYRIISFAMILGLFIISLSGCQQATEVAKNAANTVSNATTNSAPANTNTNTAANSEVAKNNTNTTDANTSPAAPPKPDNCPGPADNEVIVFEHVFTDNGGGKCKVLKPGEYKNATEIGLDNDSMSSIKIGVNVRATVCTHDNFGEPCEEFDKTDLDLMNNPTIKNDTASSIKVVEVKPESKPEAVKALATGITGEWSDGAYIFKFTDDTVELYYVGATSPYNTTPYKVVDGKTVEFKYEEGKPGKAIMTFEDNGNTLVWFEPSRGLTWKPKRIQPK